MEILIGFILFAALFFLLAIGIPVAFSLGFLSMIIMYVLWGFNGLVVIANTAYSKNFQFFMIAVPLFILMGEAIAISGIGKDAFKMVDAWLGFLPGGLAVVSVGVCTIFGAVTGFSPATVAAIGPVAIKEMLDRDYDNSFSVGVIGTAAGIAIIIPPSILMVIYAFLAEISVGKMFYGGIIPGLILSGVIMMSIILRALMNPKLAPFRRKYKWKEKMKLTIFILPFGALMFLVLGTIWGGVATPTEAAALGAAGALILPLVYGKLKSWESIKIVLLAAVRVNCMVMFILIGASLFTHILAYSGFIEKLVELIVSLDFPKWLILTFMMLGIFFLGCIMDAPSILFLTMPIYLPIASNLGFDLIWFGILLLLNLEIATMTPPVGLNLYVLKGIVPATVSTKDIIKGVTPYWAIDAIALVIVAIFPALVTWLPDKIIG